MAPIKKSQTALILCIAVLSGFAGLGYEAIWTRLFAVSLGNEIQAVLSVIAALFAGLAFGSLMFGRRVAASFRPSLWYASFEVIIAVWALALIWILPVMRGFVPVVLPVDSSPARQWCVAFSFAFTLLLPATLPMGGTLPALEAMLSKGLQRKTIGLAYAANTFGAVIGTSATAFLLLPSFGLTKTLLLCAALNCLAASAAMFLPSVLGNSISQVANETRRNGLESWPLFFTGLLGIGYEVITIRTLSQSLENTVYTFALLLGVYLFGTACGGALQHLYLKTVDGKKATAILAILTSLTCLSGTLLIAFAGSILGSLQALLPHSIAVLSAEFFIAVLVFLPPSLAMGALFSQLAQNADKSGLGRALFFNTLGAALAPILFGPIILPLLGAKISFALIACLYLLIFWPLSLKHLALSSPVAFAAIVFLMSPLSLRLTQVPEGGKLLWHKDGAMAAVSVVADHSGARYLQVNNHFRMGGDVSLRSDARQAYIPLLLHPQPKHALFLGLGTGTTVSAAVDDPHLISDGVELVPEVVESFPYFRQSAPHLGNADNLHIHIADARRFVETTVDRYDVIVADLFHPSLEGSGALYTKDHFEAIRARLNEGGIFCQWLPLYQLDLETFQIILRSFLSVYPNTNAYLAHFSVEMPLIGLVGSVSSTSYDEHWFDRRAQDAAFAGQLSKVDLHDTTSLFGLYLAGADDLKIFAGDGPINSDDLPLVQALAPHFVYGQASNTAGERLLKMLAAFHPQSASLMQGSNEDQEKLRRYWLARNQFLEVGVEMRQGQKSPDLISSIAPKLLDIVRMSGDFDAAYNPLLFMARQLDRHDPRSARQLLEALDKANPQRSDARRMLAAVPPLK